jgi:DNA-binding NarL/FixJ family response regulator
MIRLLLADDHALFLEGLRLMLEKQAGLEVVGTASDGLQLLKFLEQTPCDLVTLDLNMPHLNGLEALAEIRQKFPVVKILVLSNYEQPEFKREARRLGASGYLLKNSSIVLLVEALKHIHAGTVVFYEEKGAVTSTEKDFFTDDFLRKYSLTRREVEVIRCIAQEMTTKEMADNLFISEHTVMTHRKNLLRKLEVKNAAGLVKFTGDHGLL